MIPKFIKPTRHVERVFLHCSASDHDHHDDISVIERWHLGRGFHGVGYNGYFKKDGTFQEGRNVERAPAAQKGHNKGSLAYCCGGLTEFTEAQRKALYNYCRQINEAYGGNITFHGHCEVSNKACPVYPYKEWLHLDDEGYMLSIPPKPQPKPKESKLCLTQFLKSLINFLRG